MDGVLALAERVELGALGVPFENTLNEARRASESGDTEKVARGFELLFATILVQEMKRTLPEGFFGDGVGSETYDGWLEQHLAEAIAREQVLGVAESVRAALIRSNGGDRAARMETE